VRARANQTDHAGGQVELYTWVCMVPSMYMVGLLLTLFDPDPAGERIGWDFVTHSAGYLHFLLWSIIPVAMAFRDRQRRRAMLAGSSSFQADERTATLGAIWNGITASLSDPVFLKTCEKMYVGELERFVLEATTYHQVYFNRSETWRKTKAENIMDRYIRDTAPLQVNISHALRRTIETAVRDFDPTLGHNIFEEARTDVLLMLVDAYRLYLTLKDADGNSSMAVVPLSSSPLSFTRMLAPSPSPNGTPRTRSKHLSPAAASKTP